jgi:hypothetical protein
MAQLAQAGRSRSRRSCTPARTDRASDPGIANCKLDLIGHQRSGGLGVADPQESSFDKIERRRIGKATFRHRRWRSTRSRMSIGTTPGPSAIGQACACRQRPCGRGVWGKAVNQRPSMPDGNNHLSKLDTELEDPPSSANVSHIRRKTERLRVVPTAGCSLRVRPSTRAIEYVSAYLWNIENDDLWIALACLLKHNTLRIRSSVVPAVCQFQAIVTTRKLAVKSRRL